MQKTTSSKTTTTTALRARSRQEQPTVLTAPRPLDLKTLERVSGGTAELPKKYW